MDNNCAFRVYYGDVCLWRCMLTYGVCDRLTRCKNPPPIEKEA